MTILIPVRYTVYFTIGGTHSGAVADAILGSVPDGGIQAIGIRGRSTCVNGEFGICCPGLAEVGLDVEVGEEDEHADHVTDEENFAPEWERAGCEQHGYRVGEGDAELGLEKHEGGMAAIFKQSI